jgi:fatty-acyl-CoA synthase/long-chain acyl-CoA synthetase
LNGPEAQAPIMEIREICLGDSLDEAAARWSQRVGWVFGDERVTFAQMRDRANEAARSLTAFGLGKGDVIALWMSNRPEFAYCLMACGKIGAIVAAINTRSRSLEVEHTLRHSRAKLLVRMDCFLKMDFRAILEEVVEADAILDEGVVKSRKFPDLAKIVCIGPPATDIGTLPWSEFLAAEDKVEQSMVARIQASLKPDDPVLLQYTSGTTALPKGALCGHRYICNFGVDTILRLGVKPDEAVLNTQPYYHTGGSCGALCAPLSIGHRSVMPEYYEAGRVLSLIEREKCVARSGFGAMYLMELAHPDFGKYDLSSLRAGWCIAPPEVMRRVEIEMGIPAIVQIYGATEGGGAAGRFDDPPEKRLHSCGRAMNGTEIAVVDPESGAPLPAGAAGEIVVRGWYRMIGYFDQPEATRAVLDRDGWLHTGDIGSLDDEGYLYFRGRLKNMLKVGGENVSAEEVEAVVLQHEKVQMCAVVSAPDQRLQEVVMAVVQLKPGERETEDGIIRFCAARMANFRVPRYVRFIEEWPLTGSGKIQRHVLRERLMASVPA